MSRRRKDLGAWGEEQAVQFLERQGFSIIARNVYAPVGEIDIVAEQNSDYYFIEVKTRSSATLATDLSITSTKRRRLTKAARLFCYRQNLSLQDRSLVFAGMIITVFRAEHKAHIRFAVFIDGSTPR